MLFLHKKNSGIAPVIEYLHMKDNFIFVIGILLNPKHVTGALNSPRE